MISNDNISSLGLQPIILLTKVDQIDPELAEHPEHVYSSDLVDNYVQQLIQRKFPRGLIFPIISYFDPPVNDEPNLVKDFLLLSALSSLIFNSMKPKLSSVKRGTDIQSKPRQTLETHSNHSGSPVVEQVTRQITAINVDDPRSTPDPNPRPLLTVNVRHIDTPDGAFRRCRLRRIDFVHLKQGIKDRFQVDPVRIYELLNNNRIIIDTDEDAEDLKEGAILEFV